MSIEGMVAAAVGGATRRARRLRAIVKAREVAGSIVVTLPVQIRQEAGIGKGDRVCITVVGVGQITVTKE